MSPKPGTDYDIVIVGAGLAGVCSALHLSGKRKEILLVDSDDPPAGASAIAAGLVNPFMARKARPVWRHRDALAALTDTLELADAADLFDRRGVLRPASDAEQAGHFRATARAHAECHWLSPEACAARYSDVHAPFGALEIKSGGAVNISEFIERAIPSIRSAGVTVRLGATATRLDETPDGIEITISNRHDADSSRISCHTLIMACGAGFGRFRPLKRLGLHAVKGQTVDVRIDESLSRMPHISGSGYVVFGQERAVVGSNFEHDFQDARPDPEIGERLVTRAATMLPVLRGAEITGHRAGVRVTVERHRLPVVGSIPGYNAVWAFTGLGSKGLLMAPLIASELGRYLADQQRIPPEIRIRNEG